MLLIGIGFLIMGYLQQQKGEKLKAKAAEAMEPEEKAAYEKTAKTYSRNGALMLAGGGIATIGGLIMLAFAASI